MGSKKAAYVATVYSHLAAFHLPFMEDLRRSGYEVHAYAAPDHLKEEITAAGFAARDIPFSRSPLSPGNVKALVRMTAWLRREHYDIVHVHTPNAGFITRLAAWFAGARRVYYTAHGFHFYQGAPRLNWLIYYPLERLAARLTDVLITINDEDYRKAAGFKIRGKAVLMPGVGVEDLRYVPGEDSRRDRELALLKQQLRLEKVLSPGPQLGSGQHFFPEVTSSPRSLIILCTAELNPNKNQEQLLRAVRLLHDDCIPAVCLLAGIGPLEPFCKQLAAELNISHAVRFLGYRSDIPLLLAASDVVALVSKREGLPKALLEALSAGKPIVATDVRGSRDLVRQGDNGFLVPVSDPVGTAHALKQLYQNQDLAVRMGKRSLELSASYRLDKVRSLIGELYASPLERRPQHRNNAATRREVTGKKGEKVK